MFIQIKLPSLLSEIISDSIFLIPTSRHSALSEFTLKGFGGKPSFIQTLWALIPISEDTKLMNSSTVVSLLKLIFCLLFGPFQLTTKLFSITKEIFSNF